MLKKYIYFIICFFQISFLFLVVPLTHLQRKNQTFRKRKINYLFPLKTNNQSLKSNHTKHFLPKKIHLIFFLNYKQLKTVKNVYNLTFIQKM